jgi:spore coat protein U-like protein
MYSNHVLTGALSMQYSNTVKSLLSVAVLGFLTLGLASTSANAQANPATTTFGVSATVLKDCIVSATSMAFNNYTGAVNSSTSTVTVTCTNTTTYTVGLSAGLASGATVSTRQMQNGAALLNYGLFTNATWTTYWGNSSTAPTWVSGTGNGSAQVLTVYGQIAAGQYPTPGSYSDTITATVSY